MKKSKIYFISVLLLLLGAVFGLYFVNSTINEYQYQIDERDSLLTLQIAREDSLRNNNTELINSLNKLFLSTDIESYETFDVTDFIRKHNRLIDSLDNLNRKLEIIQNHYGIKPIVKRSKISDSSINITTSVTGSAKVDSALMLLPYFRDRIDKNKDGSWTIRLTGSEFETVEKEYEESLQKYNSLADNYNNLMSDYNSLVEDYNERQDFYKGMLKEMSKKGLIEIDTIGHKIEYTY